MGFDMKIKFDGKLIQKAKANEIDEFDDIMDGLKEKFPSEKKKGRK